MGTQQVGFEASCAPLLHLGLPRGPLPSHLLKADTSNNVPQHWRATHRQGTDTGRGEQQLQGNRPRRAAGPGTEGGSVR